MNFNVLKTKALSKNQMREPLKEVPELAVTNRQPVL